MNEYAYAPNIDQRIRALIASAKQSSERGRSREADQFLRQAEREAPRHPLVLNETALRLLGSGNQSGAVALLEQVVAAEPANPEVWFSLASALRSLNRIDEAAAALERSLAIDPLNLSALLEKAELQVLQCKPRAAAMSYRNALQLVPPGFKPPPWMTIQLQKAKEAVDVNNRALETYIDDELRQVRARYPNESLRRFDQCVETILQKRRIYRQQPTFMLFPELPTIEFYERHHFPWLDRVEAATDDIRAELLDVLSEENAELAPYVSKPPGTPVNQWRELNNSRRWSAYFLWREGVGNRRHMARCPRTVAALDGLPHWDIPGSGPTAMFSVLDATTRIPPHTGTVNTRLVVHLPLIVPPGCGFRVGGQQREWHPGKAFVFDDSIDHEAWNDSDKPRAILIFNIWSPFLSAAERELTRTLTARIGEYYGTMSNSDGTQASA
jgi:aspartyl/asparaginyl beta-hydroxylase (cupin superfamily)